MPADGEESYRLPEDPALAEVAGALRDAGHWGYVVDHQWRLVYVTDELRISFGGSGELASFAIGEHFFGAEAIRASQGWRLGANTLEIQRLTLAHLGGLVLADTPGGRDALREIVEASLRDLVDELSPAERAALPFESVGTV